MAYFKAILTIRLAVSVLAYRQQKGHHDIRSVWMDGTANMVGEAGHRDVHSTWMDGTGNIEVDFNHSQHQPELPAKKSEKEISTHAKVCQWVNFFFSTRLNISPSKSNLFNAFSDIGVDSYRKLTVVVISGAIAKLWNLRSKEWTDLDLWVPSMKQWKPFLAKPVSGVREADNQLKLPPSDHEDYAAFVEQTFNGLTPPEGMPEVDIWDPLGEPDKLLTPEVYQFFKKHRFERACVGPDRHWDYLVIEHETTAGQLAFKVGMFSGARQRPDFDDKDDPYQVLKAGTLEHPFRYKPTDLEDFTGALYLMMISPESQDLRLWTDWVEHVLKFQEDNPLRKWFRVYHDSDTEYYFTPAKGPQVGTIYKATFRNWLAALVPHYPEAPTGRRDLCTIERGLYIHQSKWTLAYLKMHKHEYDQWLPSPEHVTTPENPAPGIDCVRNCGESSPPVPDGIQEHPVPDGIKA